MKSPAFMVYGFGKEQAATVKEFMEVLTESRVSGISATGFMDRKISYILDNAGYGSFEEAEPKVLMFLDMDQNLIGPAMKYFPPKLGRPIFCSFTEQNLHWTLDYLIEHLLEERAAFGKRI